MLKSLMLSSPTDIGHRSLSRSPFKNPFLPHFLSSIQNSILCKQTHTRSSPLLKSLLHGTQTLQILRLFQ